MTTGLAEPLSNKIHGEVRFYDVALTLYRIDANMYKMEPLGLVLPRDEDDVVELVR